MARPEDQSCFWVRMTKAQSERGRERGKGKGRQGRKEKQLLQNERSLYKKTLAMPHTKVKAHVFHLEK